MAQRCQPHLMNLVMLSETPMAENSVLPDVAAFFEELCNTTNTFSAFYIWLQGRIFGLHLVLLL